MVKPGQSGIYKDEGVVKVLVVSGNGDLVIEHSNGTLTVCKSNDLRIAGERAA